MHLYTATISNFSAEKCNRMICETLPSKYWSAYFHASAHGLNKGIKENEGSWSIPFLMNCYLADALRKYLGRRYKGRVKFARNVELEPI